MNVSVSPNRFAPPSAARLWGAVALATALLVVRKPWALTTPQLWAEDGSVHLNDNDALGAAALLVPHRGYLHLLPRLIAWAASHLADVAWWPAIYNLAALAVTTLLFARMASRRLELPGKSWLVLAFALVAHTGEVFLNITNLHWLAGFFLVQQALMTRPTTPAQRVGDYALILLAGLSDPSAIIFLPLFAWRWWRERHADNLTVLLLVAACGAVQAYFLKTAGLYNPAQALPLDLLKFLEACGGRLIIWTYFGKTAAVHWTPLAQAVIAWPIIAAIVAWACRPDARRPLRLQVLAAWVLITIACVYRIRPDTWDITPEDIHFSEPYFYMSRLLLVWLVIWEFDAPARFVRWLARGACIAGALLSLPDLRVPAPTDYHWAEHCDAIRRGVPANIPTLPEGWTLEYRGRPGSR